VIESESGYIVPSGDDVKFAERVIKLLSEPERARVMGLRGQRVVEEKFSNALHLENTLGLYQELLHRDAPVVRGAVEVASHEVR